MSLQSDTKPFTSGTNYLLSPRYEIKNRQEKITIVKDGDENEKFVERKFLQISPFEYIRNGSEPGLVLIFNQESFQDNSYRVGSKRDVNEIITCMSRLGFNISENHIFTDYSRNDILQVVHDICHQDLSQVNCLIVFFLTHGDDFNLLYASDTCLHTHELWHEFNQCNHLNSKPKMFIFQACKGEEVSTIATETVIDSEMQLVPSITFQSEYIGPDMLVVYSTTEGNISFRDPKTGSWFIQELCKNFSSYGRRDDVISLIIRTSKCICRNYYHYDEEKIRKQMPIFISTLRKKFYLNRSKERNVLNKLIKDQEDLKERVQELELKVSDLLQEKDKKNK